MICCSALTAQGGFRFGLSTQYGLSGLNRGEGSVFSNFFEEKLEDKLAYSFAGLVEYGFTSRFFLQTGVKWTNKGYVRILEFPARVFITNPPNSGGVIITPTNPRPVRETFRAVSNFNYLGIPVVLKYRFGRHRSSYYLTAGVNQLFLVNQAEKVENSFDGEVVYSDTYHIPRSYFRVLNTSWIGGIGYEQALGGRFSIYLESRFELTALVYNRTEIADDRFRQFGLVAGIWFR